MTAPSPATARTDDPAWFRFRPGWSWVEHVAKSALRQDHAALGRRLRPLLAPDAVAVDVGAHGGQVTRLLADLVPRGQVVAVEPSSYARSVLRTALLLRPRRNVTVVAAALGAAPRLALLATPVKRAGAAMGYGLASLAPDARRAAVREAVPVITLDHLAEAMALPAIGLVKIDVEGFEAAVLRGAEAVLRRDAPVLVLEVVRESLARAGGASPEALWSFLEGLGYAAEPLEEGVSRPPISDGDWLFRHPRRRG
jgi:FkbM family methyltransferase